MIEALGWLELGLMVGVVVLAYTIRGITGFGSGLIAIPLLALLLPLKLVVALILVLDFSASLALSVSQIRKAPWREIWPLIPAGFLGIASAFYLLNSIDTETLSRFLGGFIVLYAFYSLSRWRPQQLGPLWWSLPSGYLGGVINGLFGTGGPVYVFYFQSRQFNKTQFRAGFSLVFMVDGLVRLIGFGSMGFYSSDSLKLLLWMLPLMLLSLWLGGRIHTSISQRLFEQGIALLLIGSGLALIWR